MGGRIIWVRAYKQKADGTLAVLIPRSIQAEMNLAQGDQLAVYEDEGRMIVEPVPEPRRPAPSKVHPQHTVPG